MTVGCQYSKLILPSAPDFVALDFETANHDPASACAVGLAFVESGRVTATHSWLIRPPRLYFEPAFIKIHGITEDKIKDQPEFCDLWQHLRQYLDDRIIIAHNAEFDINVLNSTLRHYRIARPIFRYSCTKIIAQKTWPTWKGYGLAALAQRHGFVFNHHDAAEDARVCAAIALKAFAAKAVSSFDELVNKLQITYGRVYPDGHQPVGECQVLPDIGGFAGWDAAVHRRPEQIKRRQRAAGLTDSIIDYQNQSGLINGYTVTPAGCTCIDFQERKLPCKHIYHLVTKLNGK